jgi:2-methylisocitrate lyase-like PEP mutase family enzyme
MVTRGLMVQRLRALLRTPGIKLMPCVYDGLSARVTEEAGFPITFVSGFSVAASHGMPDTGLLSFTEMEAAMQRVGGALKHIPCIGDGDTGYGNAVNCKRTVQSYGASPRQIMLLRIPHSSGLV